MILNVMATRIAFLIDSGLHSFVGVGPGTAVQGSLPVGKILCYR